MTTRRFAWIAEGDVFMMFTFDDDGERGERWVAGLTSAPIVVEVDPNSEIGVGWTYLNGQFEEPAQPEQ